MARKIHYNGNIHYKKQDFVSTDSPIMDIDAMLLSISTTTLGFVLELTVLSAFRELGLSKGIKSWAEVMLLTELSSYFLNFQHFSSVRLAKPFPLLICSCLDLVVPLHHGFVKVSLFQIQNHKFNTNVL